MDEQRKAKRKRLTIVLSLIFCLALVMGAGPGIYLINPDPSDPEATFSIFNVPVIYAWAVGWYIVQAAVAVIAFFFLWGKPQEG